MKKRKRDVLANVKWHPGEDSISRSLGIRMGGPNRHRGAGGKNIPKIKRDPLYFDAFNKAMHRKKKRRR